MAFCTLSHAKGYPEQETYFHSLHHGICKYASDSKTVPDPGEYARLRNFPSPAVLLLRYRACQRILLEFMKVLFSFFLGVWAFTTLRAPIILILPVSELIPEGDNTLREQDKQLKTCKVFLRKLSKCTP